MENIRTEKTQFVVKVTNTTEKKLETHYFESKAQAEAFKSRCKFTHYSNPIIYPITLFDRLHQ